MDLTLAKTEGLSSYSKKINPDLIVVHGDRVETLCGAIVGSLNNILVAHIEGGELSGTVDELIRHSVGKLNIHFVSMRKRPNDCYKWAKLLRLFYYWFSGY
jgi:UDP-N-acetylglucosamine 2-epimerase (hydrolysing)